VKLGAIDESLRICQETRPLKHGAPPPLDKLLPDYLLFFFSCLASFFSLAVFCGFFFSAFFVSSDLDMWLPSLVQATRFYNKIIYRHQIQISSLMTMFDKKIRTPRGYPLFAALFARLFELCQVLFPHNSLFRWKSFLLISSISGQRFHVSSYQAVRHGKRTAPVPMMSEYAGKRWKARRNSGLIPTGA